MLLEAAKSVASKLDKKNKTYKEGNAVENISIHSKMVEIGYDNSDLYAVGCWHSSVATRLLKALENIGVSCLWEDEWMCCSHCYGLVRTCADCYSWTPAFYMSNDGDICCCDCFDDHFDEYLPELKCNTNKCLPFHSQALESYYNKLDEEYESGWYDHNDSPEQVAKKLEELSYEPSARPLFNLSNRRCR